jgi:hypothetical protein
LEEKKWGYKKKGEYLKKEERKRIMENETGKTNANKAKINVKRVCQRRIFAYRGGGKISFSDIPVYRLSDLIRTYRALCTFFTIT